jgi:hypothetical protein
MGWFNPDARYPETETFVDGKTDPSLTIPRGINIYRSPNPKLSNLVFDDGVLIENGKLIFGIVEKKTVGAQGGLVRRISWAKRVPRQLGSSSLAYRWLLTSGFSTMASVLGLAILLLIRRLWPRLPKPSPRESRKLRRSSRRRRMTD